MKRISFIVEPILFLVLIIICGFLIGSPGYIEYTFHPFYFVILVITIRYGYGKGVFSMLYSSGSFVFFYVLEKGYFNFFELWESYYQPVTFLAFWMFIGLLVDMDKKKIEKLTENNKNQKRVLNDKVSEIKKLNAINENISNELISSDRSFNILFEKTKNLFNEDIDMLYHAAYEILKKSIQASEAYILYVEGDRIEMASSGNAELDRRYLEVHNKEIEEVRKSHKFIRLDMLDSRSTSNKTPVFIGPIIHQPTDTLFGLIIVQELDYLKYNKNTFRTYINLCKWLGEILYFRTKQNLNIVPIKSGREFDYLVEYGVTRYKIKKYIEECFL